MSSIEKAPKISAERNSGRGDDEISKTEPPAFRGSASARLPRRPFTTITYSDSDDMLLIRCCPCTCLLTGKNQKTVLDFPRSFFRLPNFPGGNDGKIGHRRKEYSEKRLLGWKMEQVYDIVADVEKYRDFVPWCNQSSVSYRKEKFCRAELVIGFPPVVERYTSNISLERPTLVKSVANEGTLFNNLVTTWKFSPGLQDNPNTCTLNYSVSFEFRNVLHAHLVHLFFDQVINTMVHSFLKRSEQLHGKPSIPSHKMKPQILDHKS